MRPCGFSLLELLVALVFMGLLLGGMVRVWAATLASWTRVNESLSLQRGLRWSMERIRGDLRMMGCLFPPPELRALDLAADPQMLRGFRLVPGQLDGQPADELSWVMDAPVPIEMALAGAIQGPGPEGPATVRVRPAAATDLQAGDLLLVAGDWFEFAQVAEPASLVPGRAGPVRVVRPDGQGAAAFAHPHDFGALVRVVRPLRVVRYAVVLEPGGKGGRVPCLVRFETAYPRDRTAPDWDRLSTAGGGEGGREVVARNVVSFRVDFSPDRSFPGIRDGPAAGAGAAADPPLWRRAGGLFEVRLALRGPVARDDDSPAGRAVRRFPVRSQTLVASPWNAGL